MNLRVIVYLASCAFMAPVRITINAESGGIRDIPKGPFHLRLYKLLDKKENMVFSPNSVAGALHLLYEASDGSTLEAIERALITYPVLQPPTNIKSSLEGSGGLTYYRGSIKVYADEDFLLNGTYTNTLEDKYRAEFDEHVHFNKTQETAASINEWIANRTEYEFKGLVNPTDLDANTELMLVSIADFYYQYAKMFNPNDTKMQTFYLNNKDTKQVEMMHMDGVKLSISFETIIGAQILQIPFYDRNFELVILLPFNRGNIDDMKEKMFTENTFSIKKLLKNTEMRMVNLALPKFFVNTTFDLKECFTNMGLKEIFTNDASFPGLAAYGQHMPELFASQITHEAFINVTERQAVAVGASVDKMSIKPESIDDPPMYFVPLEHFNKVSRTMRSTDEPKVDFIGDNDRSSSSKTERSTEGVGYNYIVDHPFIFFMTYYAIPEGTTYTLIGQVYDP